MAYPALIRLLMDRTHREDQLKSVAPKLIAGSALADGLSREYTLNEIAIITRAGPARLLGLTSKGHLGVGADADVTIYPGQPNEDGTLFSYPRYVLKRGEVVVEEGEVRSVSEGREFVFRPAYDPKIEEYLRPQFQKVYTMSFDNYPTEMERLRHPHVVEASAEHA
jgi:formylmethanofuran dehydrogenase subunit A